ncbi:tRNA-dihydrouridine synthase [Leptolinea sp. HRD-7]|nr:tRNA-dihydrouridine synthase [Leptolinea sp. HRD-7]
MIIKDVETKNLTPVFKIGDIPIFGDVILAPMDGYTDHPFRLICRKWGAACIYSEFINGLDLEGKHPPHLSERLFYHEAERPFGYQILDDLPERILNTARYLRSRNPDFIDINMGCCSRTVCSRGAGASLLLEPDKVSLIISKLTAELDIPVTAKIRLGWDEKSRNYLDIARRIEDAGASALAVHGRTKTQMYRGMADWDAISEVKQALRIPVIGNGDVKTADQIGPFLHHTKCDAVMIGRGAVGNPWIFARKNRSDCSRQEIFNTLKDHLFASMEYFGENHGLIVFRKQAINYMQNDWLSPDLRREALTTTDWHRFLSIIEQNLLS